jgi:primosomal protein N' (replication factor Y)
VAGYVLRKKVEIPDYRLKEISDLPDPEPLFPEQMVPFFEWMADYYRYPVGMAIDAALPGEQYKCATITAKGKAFLEGRLFESAEIRILRWIEKNPGKRLSWPMKDLYPIKEKGFIRIEPLVRSKTTEKAGLIKCVRPVNGVTLETALSNRGSRETAQNEAEFLKTVFIHPPVPLSRLRHRFKNGPYLVNKWVKRGFLEYHERSNPVEPGIEASAEKIGPHPLNPHQAAALTAIKHQLDQTVFSPFLLYGVTGSGKTEVYARAIEHLIGTGRQAILMAPEILLAEYLHRILRPRVGKRVSLYHSNLSPNERRHQWSQNSDRPSGSWLSGPAPPCLRHSHVWG